MSKSASENTQIILYSVLCVIIFFERFFLIFFFSSFYDEFFNFIENPYLLIGYVPLVFFAIFILSRYIYKARRLVMITIILLPIIYLVAYPTAMYMTYNHFSHFNINTWKNHTKIRSWMITDLKERYFLKGLSKKEIISLLGEPTNQDSDYFYYDVGNNFPNYEPFWIKFKEDIVIDTRW